MVIFPVLPKLFEDEPRASSWKKRSKNIKEAHAAVNTQDKQDCNDSEDDLFSSHSSVTGSQQLLKDTEIREQVTC